MIVSGDPIGADEALQAGLVDEIVEGDLTAAGVAFAEKVLAEKRPLKKIRDLTDKIAAVRGKPEVFAEFRKSVARQSRGFRAPENCIKAVEAAVNLPFDEGLKRERELFVELLNSPESKAQRYFFFAEREAAKVPDVPADTQAKEIRKAAVIGAGHDGRRHRHELRQRRDSRHRRRGGPGRARPRARRRAQELRGHGFPRPAHRGRRREADGAHPRHHGLERHRRRRHRHRGRVRGDADQEGGLRQARHHREAGCRARDQHVDARRQRDRGERPSGRRA